MAIGRLMEEQVQLEPPTVVSSGLFSEGQLTPFPHLPATPPRPPRPQAVWWERKCWSGRAQVWL